MTIDPGKEGEDPGHWGKVLFGVVAVELFFSFPEGFLIGREEKEEKERRRKGEGKEKEKERKGKGERKEKGGKEKEKEK
jgi:hypothetical protein